MTFLLGLPGVLLGLAKRLFGLLRTLQPFQLLSLALALLSGFLWLQNHRVHREARKWEERSKDCTAMREFDRQEYERAAKQAEAANKAQIAAVAGQQDTITKDVSHDYQTQLAALRAADRMRRATQANPGRANGDRASALSTGAGGTAPAPLPLSDADLLLAAETELQLNALIDWTERQHAIDPNKEPS